MTGNRRNIRISLQGMKPEIIHKQCLWLLMNEYFGRKQSGVFRHLRDISENNTITYNR
jgi:hypothetical protein